MQPHFCNHNQSVQGEIIHIIVPKYAAKACIVLKSTILQSRQDKDT